MARCRSFVALYPEGFDSTEEPTWFPEYDIDLGRPLAAVAANLQAMCSGTVAGRACSILRLRDLLWQGRLQAARRECEVDFEPG
jgi:hypothetical protein